MANLFTRALDFVRGRRGEQLDVITPDESIPLSEHTASLPKDVALGVIRLAMEQGKLPPNVVGPELGITGTPNYRGDVYSESNVKLIHQEAFGQPGSRTWGEWQRILMTDPAVHAANEAIKAVLRDCEVSIEPAAEESGVPKALAQQQADALKANLFDMLDPGWPTLLAQLAEATVYGFSLHEKVWTRAESKYLPQGSGIIVSKLAERLPVSIHPYGWKERNGDLDHVVQWGLRNESDRHEWVQELKLPADRLLLHSWNRRGNNYLGHSAWRAVWYPCKIREHLLKVTAIGITRESVGVPYAYTDKANVKMSSSQRAQIQTFLENNVYHENAALTLPSGWKMDWFYSPGANKGHVVEAYNSLGAIILSQVGRQWMQLGVQSQTGSRSVGEVQKSASDDFDQGVITSVENVLNGTGLNARPYTGLARSFVIANWGPMPAYPRIKLSPRKAQLDPSTWAAGVNTLKAGGMISVWRRDDENDARERFALDPVSQEEWDEQQRKAEEEKAAMREQMQQQGPGTGGPGEKGTPPRGGGGLNGRPGSTQPPASDKPKALSAGAAFMPRRPLRPSEQHMALGEMADFLDTRKEAFERGVKPIVVMMLHAAAPQLRAAAADDGRIDHAEVSKLKLDTTQLESFIGSFVARARVEGWRQVAAERSKQLGHTLAAGDNEPDPSEEWARLEEALKKKLARDIADRQRRAIEAAAIDGERRDESPDEILSGVVADAVESKALQGDAATVVTRAFSMGREQFADEYSDEIESAELSAVLDDNTCEYCERMDGTEMEFGSAEYETLTPPLKECDGGSRCRCLVVFNFKKSGFKTEEDEAA